MDLWCGSDPEYHPECDFILVFSECGNGIAGAALATVIARGMELAICMVDALQFQTVRFRISVVFEKIRFCFRII